VSELLCVSATVIFWLPFLYSTRPVKVCTPLSVVQHQASRLAFGR
jgi:hypothetical protein